MFSSGGNFDLQLDNCREIVLSKAGEDKALQEFLVSEVFSFNAAEGSHLASVLQLQTNISSISTQEGSHEKEDEINQSSEEAVEYFELPFAEEKIQLVDSREKFLQFLSSVESFTSVTGRHVGLDVEFFQQKLSLIQISLEEEIYLLDWEVLPSSLTETDFLSLRNKFLLNKNCLIVGFGVIGDLKLVSRSVPGCEDIRGVSVLDLERVRRRLCQLVSLETSTVRGLSGLCHSVLGKRLCKAQQISDWSRRPLRQAQLTYAALDAFSCWKIFQVFKDRAKQMSLERKFEEIVRGEVNKGDQRKKKEKVKLNREEARVKLESSVAELVPPLFSSAQEPGEVRLVCDDMLQGLCRRLRMFGVDCLALSNGQDHLDCVSLATEDSRFVLSRGNAATRINKRLPPGHTLNITSDQLDLQLEEVFRYFNITADPDHLFSRCVLCNGSQYYELSRDLLIRLADNVSSREEECEEEEKWETVLVTDSHAGEERKGKVNMRTGHTERGTVIQVKSMARATISKYSQFRSCGDCGKIYFEGSHWEKASDSAKTIFSRQ